MHPLRGKVKQTGSIYEQKMLKQRENQIVSDQKDFLIRWLNCDDVVTLYSNVFLQRAMPQPQRSETEAI